MEPTRFGKSMEITKNDVVCRGEKEKEGASSSALGRVPATHEFREIQKVGLIINKIAQARKARLRLSMRRGRSFQRVQLLKRTMSSLQEMMPSSGKVKISATSPTT